MRDPHEMLGVSRTASQEEIRRSYRKLVRRYHPDLNPEDPRAEERFKELQQAYESLMKARKQPERASPERPRDSGSAEGVLDLSNFLKSFGYRTKGSFGGETGHLRELSEEDISRLLRRFGIDTAKSSRIRVSFGDAANFERLPFEEKGKDRPRKPPPGDDLKRPPKPPKPPRW